MGTARLNIALRGADCKLLKTCWMCDLAIQTCDGTPLVDLQLGLVEQLQRRYGTPASVVCTSQFPLTGDQVGKTLELTVNGVLESLTFATGSTELASIYAQLKAAFNNVEFSFENGLLVVTTKTHGPDTNLTISGDCQLTWGPVKTGDGIKIYTREYHGAKRINFYPGNNEKINHIEMDVMPGCYKIWARCCFGNNEETNMVMAVVESGDHREIDLLLPAIKTCSGAIMHPIMEKVAMDEVPGLIAEEDKLAVFRTHMVVGGFNKAIVEAQLADRLADLQAAGQNTDRVYAVIELAALLPQCY